MVSVLNKSTQHERVNPALDLDIVLDIAFNPALVLHIALDIG